MAKPTIPVYLTVLDDGKFAFIKINASTITEKVIRITSAEILAGNDSVIDVSGVMTRNSLNVNTKRPTVIKFINTDYKKALAMTTELLRNLQSEYLRKSEDFGHIADILSNSK